MEKEMNNLFSLSLSLDFSLLTVIIRLFAAALMGGLIGSERGRHGRAAGLRTHILVCVGAAMTSLTSMYLSEALGFNGDVARISAQVISGIGFLGAGTILIRNSSVITGLTTAAGMWATAAIGVAVGYGFYSGAVIATLIGIFSVTVLSRFERKRKNNISVYVEVRDITEVGDIVKLKKPHPCGSYEWEILRVGADFRLKCMGCGHMVMVTRRLVEKNTRGLRKPD